MLKMKNMCRKVENRTFSAVKQMSPVDEDRKILGIFSKNRWISLKKKRLKIFDDEKTCRIHRSKISRKMTNQKTRQTQSEETRREEERSLCKFQDKTHSHWRKRMTSETNSTKRPRRSKRDPQFVFERSTREENEILKCSKVKSSRPAESTDNDGELYEPGDIVWCKLGNFPWWPALIVSWWENEFNTIDFSFSSFQFRCEAEGAIHTKLLSTSSHSSLCHVTFLFSFRFE